MKLSVLCVTQFEPCAAPMLVAMKDMATAVGAEFVIVADGDNELPSDQLRQSRCVRLKSQGFIESVLDEALSYCTGEYVLRLDDDERCSPAMVQWLFDESFTEADHWKFPRVHLWPDVHSVLMTPHLFPDEQTRLSVKAKAGGRRTIHAPSPYGSGVLAPVAIEHHKFLIKTREQREQTSRQWHSGNMLPFSLPEQAYDKVQIVAHGRGNVPWNPLWKDVADMRDYR